MFLEHHIIIISVGSCDTEDWSTDAVNSALITGIKVKGVNVFLIKKTTLQCFNCTTALVYRCPLAGLIASIVLLRNKLLKILLND